ncbi:XrtA/PEP-CTERM system-associated ATPase [Ectothiorhodospira lacustris]|uniref:XrtA/PEP-CTERM system-associated ATPase n=1 Tax=Ectothiorhodospira lacustris TaxID=2899127 RepID=UPI001EE7983D|nr:XrtA/PEP-CTERM system-associated ATPase [Ectothiorhodospira lacustris]MCG5501053.1 XrtA-associated ATPase [Ectothiorhodospira lacustris]MCG5510322.1 XrtA-associated ATPase [Ectothiorhodospira lacustris]MCG5522068.1 XrtA-associated ATPase [Ectothiorhodospira lacustris]
MYEAYFNLDRKPFQLSPDPQFFFGSRIHKRALAYLRYGLSQGEGFIAITGDVGTGKTTLVRMLFNDISERDYFAAQIVTTQLHADDLLRMVAMAFGMQVGSDSKANLLTRIERFLVDKSREGKRVLLVIDEAQNLPPHALEELRMLSNFQLAGRPLLQSFLLGQNQFRRTLQMAELEQFRQRFIAACHLTPLSQEETEEYIRYRLEHAGWKNDPAFEAEAFAEVYRQTQGIPRRINSLADRLLLYAFLEERHEISAEVVQTVARELGEEISAISEEVGVGPVEDSMNRGIYDGQGLPAHYSWGNIELRVSALESRIQSLEKSFYREISLLRRAVKHLMKE